MAGERSPEEAGWAAKPDPRGSNALTGLNLGSEAGGP